MSLRFLPVSPLGFLTISPHLISWPRLSQPLSVLNLSFSSCLFPFPLALFIGTYLSHHHCVNHISASAQAVQAALLANLLLTWLLPNFQSVFFLSPALSKLSVTLFHFLSSLSLLFLLHLNYFGWSARVPLGNRKNT